ncbi:MAG: alpha/beta hydrolase [Halobacteriales archaeon]
MSQPDLPLNYKRIEARTDTSGSRPAAFVLHGRGADETDLLPVAQRFPDELEIISLQAPNRMGMGYTWYELDLSEGGLHESQPDPEDFRRSLDLVAETVIKATDVFDLDPGRIGLFGFSQGAITSMCSLLETPDRYAWCVALHGYLPESHADLTPDGIEDKPVFIAGGSVDDVIPASRVERAGRRFRELGSAVDLTIFDTGHSIGPDELNALLEWIEQQVTE